MSGLLVLAKHLHYQKCIKDDSDLVSSVTQLKYIASHIKHLQGQHDQSSHSRDTGKKPVEIKKRWKPTQEDLDNLSSGTMSLKTYDKVAKIHDEFWLDDYMNAFNFTSDSGLKVEMFDVAESVGSVTFMGTIKNKKGTTIGMLTRKLTPNKTIEHVSFQLHRSEQGKGFGSEYYQHAEKEYMKIGTKRITLTANMDVGGYAWARMGFDFSNAKEASVNKDAYDMQWESAYDTKPPHAAKPWEIASAVGPDGKKMGKDVLLGESWEAVKVLDPNSEGFQVGQAYYKAREAKRKKKALKQQQKTYEESDINGFWGPDEADDGWHVAIQKLLSN